MKVVELCARKKNRSSHNFPFNLGKVEVRKWQARLGFSTSQSFTSMKFELWPITTAYVVY